MKRLQARIAQLLTLTVFFSSALGLLLTTGTKRVYAASYTVTSNADGGMGSLREAITSANSTAGADIIDITATGTIDLLTSLPDLSDDVTIDGPGANVLSVQRSTAGGAPNFRIFTINPGKTVAISGLTIANGSLDAGSNGGGISNQGMLTLNNCTVSGNSAGPGGGIFNRADASANTATLAINNSTISGNSAVGGGGIFNQGDGSGNTATLAINNSTISGNSAFSNGGGIQNDIANAGTAILTINNSTISGNSAGFFGGPGGGGGIVNNSAATIGGSIIALNNASFGPDVFGTFTSNGFNLIGDVTDGIGFTQPTDQTGLDPMLELDGMGSPLLKDNGGPTKTIALLSNSPAIDKGKNFTSFTTDQRGVNRPIDDPAIPPASGGDNSDIGAFEFSAPTAVELNAFAATAYENGVLLEWQTGFEVDNLGFRLYREKNGQRVLVNSEIIAGSALKVGAAVRSGYSYGWWDASIADCGLGIADCQNAQYWLEDLDLNGGSRLHGPFKVSFAGGKPPAQSQAETLSHLVAGKVFVGPPLMTSQPGKGLGVVSPAQFDVAAEPALKMTIKAEGWYRVSQPELAAAGFDVRGNPRNLQLFVDGIEQPILVAGESDGALDATDAVEFYATGQNKAETDAHVYWLAAGNQTGKRISVSKTTGKPGGATSFLYTVERRERSIYVSALLNGETENFFGSVITSQSVEQPLTLQHVAADAQGGAELEIALQGVTDLPGNADHIVSVAINGVFAGRVVFDGRQHKVERFSVYQSYLREGENQITLQSEGGTSDISLVDYIRVSYWHGYTVDDDVLRLTASANNGATQTIAGFTSPLIRVFDITDAGAITETAGQIAGKSPSYSVTVDVAGANRTLFAVSEAQIKSPASIALNRVSNLRNPAQGVALLILSRREFFEALAPLVSLRQSQKLSVAVVDIEDIFDEFNYGEKSPQAVKDFLAYTQSSWKKKPRFVLLGGDASCDAKNYLGFGDSDLVPTKLIDTTFMQTASDDWLVDFNNDGVAELAVGRLPFRTANEAAKLIAKLIDYDRNAPSQEILLSADANDGYNFELASDQLRPLIPGNLRVNTVYRGQVEAEKARFLLLEAIKRGQKLVNYAGHGSAAQWRGNLLTNADAATLTDSGSLSVFVLMTCLNGYYMDPALDSLGEALLKADGGAVAVWASSGMCLPDEQAVMNQELYRLIFDTNNRGLKLGEIARQAKQAARDDDVRRTWILLGDPTMRLR